MNVVTNTREKKYVSDSILLMAEWDWEKNKQLGILPEHTTIGSGKRAFWLCKLGHSWSATIDKRAKGTGCPYCSGRLVSELNRLSVIKPEIASEWDFSKNFPLTPEDVPFSSNKRYWWKCKNNHSWIASCNSRSNGNGCPYCNGKKPDVNHSLLTEFPDIAKEWDYSKNTGITPADFLPFSSKRVWWKCSKGHTYQKSIAKRSAGFSCPICSNRTVCSGVNDLKTTHPLLAIEWDYENNNITPEMVHAGSTKKVWWKCKNGHQWEASIVNRSRGRGCPYCSGKISSPEWNLAVFSQRLLDEWDYEKNEDTSPTDYTPYSNKKVWWKCALGHSWRACINKRANGSNCPICWGEMRTSFPEQCVLYYVKQAFKNVSGGYQYEQDCKTIEFDIFIHDINVAIEYDGVRFHKDRLQADKDKNNFAKTLGIELYRIREDGCPSIRECTVIITDTKYTNNDFSSLEIAIKTLLKALGHSKIDICIEKDQNKILDQYVSFRKEHSIATVYPSLLLEWDFERNGGISPQNISYGSGKKFWWKCKLCGYQYYAAVNHKSAGRGCPACAGKVLVKGTNDLATKFPIVAQDWNFEKNGGLQPNQVFPKSHRMVWWKCSSCGYEWKTIIANKTRKNFCPNCQKRDCL